MKIHPNREAAYAWYSHVVKRDIAMFNTHIKLGPRHPPSALSYIHLPSPPFPIPPSLPPLTW